jgi:CPA2 family monovalent cation:H+ antiporter-2
LAAEQGAVIPYIAEIVIFLATLVAVALVSWRLKISPILGYLAVGIVIGPYGAALLDDVEGVRRIAELGVVFLLFIIGLELSLQRLNVLKRFIFGLGAVQVAATGALLGALAFTLGYNVQASIVIGAGLALSSTAMVMQLLAERGEVASHTGRVSVAILLFQDLAVVPLIVLVNLFARPDGDAVLEQVALALGKGLAAVAVIYLIGRLVFYRLFRAVAHTRVTEVFMAMTLIGVLGTAWLTAQAGFSMALGAFLAGLLLAESEFRHQVESDIQPFKGLMLGLFFMGVGMGIDLNEVADRASWLFGAVAILLIGKTAVIFVLARLFALSNGLAAHVALLLAGGGEFAFVVFGVALSGGVLPAADAQFMLSVAALSMMLTPLLASLGAKAKAKLRGGEILSSFLPETCAREEIADHVVIAGYGRVGQTIARLLNAQQVPYRALDLNVSRARHFHAKGEPVYYGDATQRDIMAALGARTAAAVVITLDHHESASRTVETLRQFWPGLPVFVRARDGTHARTLRAAGAAGVVPETVESSLQLCTLLLEALHVPRENIADLIKRIRAEDYQSLLNLDSSVYAPTSASRQVEDSGADDRS